MADIELSFGVKGGASGVTTELQKQLESIITSLNKNEIEIGVKLNQKSLDALKAQIAKLKELASNGVVNPGFTKNPKSNPSGDASKKMAAQIATNRKMLRSYVSAMDSLQQSFVKASVKNSKTGQLGADYKKVAGMYKSMRTEFQKMLSGEKGPITNKLLNTSLSMLEKYKAKLIEVQTLQRNVLSGSTSGGMTTPLTQATQSVPKVVGARTQKYLSQVQSMYMDVEKQLSSFLGSNRLYGSDTIDSTINRAKQLQRSLGSVMSNTMSTSNFDLRGFLASRKQFESFGRDMAAISKQNL